MKRTWLVLVPLALLLGAGGTLDADEEGDAIAALLERGAALEESGLVDAAAAVYGEAADVARRAGLLAAQRDALKGQVRTLHRSMRLVELLEVAERLKAVFEHLGDTTGAKRTEADQGSIQAMLGQYDKAEFHLKRALAAFDRPEHAATAAQIRESLARTSMVRGNLVEALGYGEAARQAFEALGDPVGRSYAETVLGDVHARLGLYDEAMARYERALEGLPESDWQMRADVAQNMAWVEYRRHELDAARQHLLEALEAYESGEDVHGLVRTLVHLTYVLIKMGKPEKAIAYATQATKRTDADTDPLATAHTDLALGGAMMAAGLHRMATEKYESVLRKAEREEWGVLEAHARRGLAECHLATENLEDALDEARRAVRLQETQLEGLGDEHRISAREQGFRIFEVGLRIALAAKSVEDAMEWMERSRAGGLLESIGGRLALRGEGLPSELSERQAKAQGAVWAAELRYQATLQQGRRDAIQAAHEAVAAAQREYADVVELIQESRRRRADVSHPVPATIREVQATLLPGEVFLSYAMLSEVAMALLIPERGEARLIDLGPPERIRALCQQVHPEVEEAEGMAPSIEELATLLLGPLDLPEGTRQLLVAPDGALRRVPFPALAAMLEGESPEVILTPSGSTHNLLTEERALRGKNVLAAGDPVYSWPSDSAAVRVYNDGRPLRALPHTRDEVLAITGDDDVRLLRETASEASVKASVLGRPRWRAVHLACHGRLDLDRPSVCALALTPGRGEDGFLTALEVFGMEIPADLVVLSACESGGGRIARGEGTLGLVRAFIVAGASRVLCSLWEVDDQATRVLMEKFHDAWRGKEGLDAAAALRKAQAHVRAQEGWEHPSYWAAWVLWGVPD